MHGNKVFVLTKDEGRPQRESDTEQISGVLQDKKANIFQGEETA